MYGLKKTKFKIQCSLEDEKSDFFEKKIIKEKRSFCDGCGRQLKWYENIPLVSWLLQCGRTRCCGKKLPIAYPIIEFLTGIFLILNFKFLIFNQIQNFNFQIFLLFFLESIIITFLIFSAVFDLKYMVLPDFSTVVLIVTTALIFLTGVIREPLQNLAMGITVSLFFLFLYLVTKGKGMGLGDVKLVFFIGLFLGWKSTMVALYTAFIVGAIIGIILMILNKAKRKTEVPFGPFLILGTFIGWWWGSKIWEYFLKILF